MTQPRKVVIIIVQVIVEPLGLRQERILEKQVSGERVIDHRVGAACKV